MITIVIIIMIIIKIIIIIIIGSDTALFSSLLSRKIKYTSVKKEIHNTMYMIHMKNKYILFIILLLYDKTF